jgi:hypothetical protein
MLFIDKDLPAIAEARETHLSNVTCRIRKKLIGGSCGNDECDVCGYNCHLVKGWTQNISDLLTQGDTLEVIISGLPNELMEKSAFVWNELVGNFSWEEYYEFLSGKNTKAPNAHEQHLNQKYKDAYDLLYRLFDYETWFLNGKKEHRYDAYQLAENLDRHTCTYCNRLYTHTMKTLEGGKVMRPTFDHWFSHSKHPLLSLSFYNLIPSCSLCNSSVKGTDTYDINLHLHPYLDKDCCEQISFDYTLDNDTLKYNIHLVPQPGADRALKSYEDLKLSTIYGAHQSELADLIKTKNAYSEQYISGMMQTYAKAGLSHQEVYRLAFGVELESAEFHKRPLSKFKKDILAKLKII